MVDVRSGVFGRSNRQPKELGTPSRHVTTSYNESHGQLQLQLHGHGLPRTLRLRLRLRLRCWLVATSYHKFVSYLCLSFSLFLCLRSCFEPAPAGTVHCHQMDDWLTDCVLPRYICSCNIQRLCMKRHSRKTCTKRKKFKKILARWYFIRLFFDERMFLKANS